MSLQSSWLQFAAMFVLVRDLVIKASYSPGKHLPLFTTNGIPSGEYLQRQLPGIDRRCQFILQKGCSCLIYKLNLQHTC